MAGDVKNREELHEQNIRAILAEVFNQQPIARVDISKNLSLNKSTVSALYFDLKERGVVSELGEGQASTSGGRKPVLIAINNRYGFTINFDFGYRHLHIMRNDISGGILDYSQADVEGLRLSEIVQIIDEAIHDARRNDRSEHGLLGISFAIHGTVHNNQVTYSPFMDMEGIDLANVFETKYQVPVLLENEANLSAVYERDFNDGHALNNAVTVSIHRGIGAGIIVNKELYHGDHGEAGEIGRSVIIGSALGQTMMKVEDFCSEEAIISQLGQIKANQALDRQSVVELYNQHAEDAVTVLNGFIRNIAMIISNVQNNYDPATIFINSPLIEELPSLLPPITDHYQKMTKSNPVPIKMIADSHAATLQGGCALITRQVLDLENFELNFSAK